MVCYKKYERVLCEMTPENQITMKRHYFSGKYKVKN